MANPHLITPPPDLVQQWDDEATDMLRPEYQQHLTARAAQWGADQELEACCEWIPRYYLWDVEQLRAARRKARAYLSQPEPEEPTDAELQQLWQDLYAFHDGPTSGEVAEIARVVLDRWGSR